MKILTEEGGGEGTLDSSSAGNICGRMKKEKASENVEFLEGEEIPAAFREGGGRNDSLIERGKKSPQGVHCGVRVGASLEGKRFVWTSKGGRAVCGSAFVA